MEVIMSINLSIKNVPNEIAEKLRDRAKKAHRSLQGELMVILEQAVQEEKPISLGMVRDRARAYRIRTADESAKIIRDDRDGR